MHFCSCYGLWCLEFVEGAEAVDRTERFRHFIVVA